MTGASLGLLAVSTKLLAAASASRYYLVMTLGERVVAERADGDDGDAALGAEDSRFGEQQQVSSGQIDCVVRSPGMRNFAASRAPVRAVNVAHGKREDSQWSNGVVEFGSDGTEELTEVAEFGFLPHETVADENRINFRVTLRQLRQHHATVQAAADQGANR